MAEESEMPSSNQRRTARTCRCFGGVLLTNLKVVHITGPCGDAALQACRFATEATPRLQALAAAP